LRGEPPVVPDQLAVRCIELHKYEVDGSLLDPGHRDNGSARTISVLLSHPHEFSGGQFVTYSEGFPVMHELAEGDAVLFHSEQLHNVVTVTSGVRFSLVVELWARPANSHDRYS